MKPAVTEGDGPVLLAQPHGGSEIPDAILQRLNEQGHARADADWHIGRLYAGLLADASIVSTPIHRYVIDANRDPADESLYPGQNTTSLCPTTTFDGGPIYLPAQTPSLDEIQQRQQQYHQPYHDALAEQLQRIHQRHGYAILYDCHSIRSLVPYLFDGKLPDFNIGSNSGASCDPAIEAALRQQCIAAGEYSSVLNGRFKGGWTTRHYGQPQQGYHAIQMELAQCNYMSEQPPWNYEDVRADKLRVVLGGILATLATSLA
ncbi:MAG: N-formylglutamate deformylase [Gammaproteobacteria bacterium]|nr:N-formylglutamate deformylase [Gammaproteobacteria bacterium]